MAEAMKARVVAVGKTKEEITEFVDSLKEIGLAQCIVQAVEVGRMDVLREATTALKKTVRDLQPQQIRDMFGLEWGET